MARYGNAKIVTIMRDFNRLRVAIRSHDTFATEEAWEKCERWIDFVFAAACERDGTPVWGGKQ